MATEHQSFYDTLGTRDLWQQITRDGRGFAALTGFVNIVGTDEFAFMLIRNPAGSSVLVRLKEFILTLGATATQRSLFRFYRSPVITSEGTPLTISKVLTISDKTSVVKAYQSPTVSSNGVLIQPFQVGLESFARDQDLGRYLVPGSDILITVKPSSSNIEHSVSFLWGEEPI